MGGGGSWHWILSDPNHSQSHSPLSVDSACGTGNLPPESKQARGSESDSKAPPRCAAGAGLNRAGRGVVVALDVAGVAVTCWVE